MAASPALLGAFTDLTDLAIQKIVKKEAKNVPTFRSFYNFRTTQDLIEKDSSITGLKEAEFTAQNAEIFEDVSIQGFDQTYTQQAIDIVFPMSYQVWKFGFTQRKLTSFVQQVLSSLDRKKEKLAAERLTNGFSQNYTHNGVNKNTTITITGGDALEPWTTSHTREDSGTNMNNVITDGTTNSMPFDYAGYKAANRTASLFVDGRGNPMPARFDTLICKTGSSVFHKAMEILGAIKKNEIPETNDNDGSALPPFKVLQNDFLTKDAAWGMFDSSLALNNEGEHGFQHIESEANNVDAVNIVKKTREMQIIGHSLFIQGLNDVARSWAWSEGDSSQT